MTLEKIIDWSVLKSRRLSHRVNTPSQVMVMDESYISNGKRGRSTSKGHGNGTGMSFFLWLPSRNGIWYAQTPDRVPLESVLFYSRLSIRYCAIARFLSARGVSEKKSRRGCNKEGKMYRWREREDLWCPISPSGGTSLVPWQNVLTAREDRRKKTVTYFMR